MDSLSVAVLVSVVLVQGAWLWFLARKRTGKATWSQYNFKEKIRELSLVIIGVVIVSAGIVTAKLIMWLFDRAH